MYKTLLLSLLSAAVSAGAVAQEDSTQPARTGFSKDHFYLRAGVGYATPQGASMVDYSLTSYKVKRASLATGLNETLGVGYNLNDYIGVELDGSLFSANKKYSYGENNYNYNLGYNSINETSANVQSLVLLMPGLVLHTAPNRLSAYTRVSLVLPVANKYSYTTYNPVNLSTETVKYTTHFALGVNVAAGLSYKISPRISVWAEASALSLTPHVKKETITGYTVNGVNKLNTLPQQENNYAMSGSSGYTTTQQGTQTQTGSSSTFSSPFSNIGYQAGIGVNIGRKNEHVVHVPHLQKHWYVKAGVGYALPTLSSASMERNYSTVNTYNTNSGVNTSATTFQNKRYSLLGGLNGTIGAGYMLGRHFGLELDADLQLVKTKYSSTYYATETGYIGGNEQYVNTEHGHAKMPGFLTPSFVMQTGGKVLNLYSRVGLALPGSTKQEGTVTYNNVTTQTTDVTSMSYTMKFTLGYTAAAGVSYKLTERLKLWGEVSMLSYNPTVKQENFNSSNQYGMPAQYNLHSSGPNTNNSANPVDVSNPEYKLSYSNVGAKVGVAFGL